MNNFNEIIGHEDIIHHMQSALRTGKISHAYILEGVKGIGKSMLAHTFAKTLQCENEGDSPCNQCSSCKLFDSNNHPDVIWVETEKKRGIGVDDIREQLNSDVNIKPYRYRYKIYIIKDADSMTEQAQNAMLKTIEEPPEYAIIMLLAQNASRFLQTILSRCIVLSLKPVKEEAVKTYLIQNKGLSHEIASIYASFSRGSIGLALELCESDDFNKMRNEIIETVNLIMDKLDFEIMEKVQAFIPYKDQYQIFFDLFLTWLRDLLVIKKVVDEKYLIHRDKYNILLKQGKHLSYNRICRLINNIEEAREMQRVNVNYQLSLEMMLLNY